MKKNMTKKISIILAMMMTVVFIPVTSYASSKADTITYTTDAEEEITFKEKDFNKECKELMGEKLDYVKFELPSSSKGVLYYDYDDDKDKVDDSDKYYYDDDDEKSISDVTFLPEDDYSGTVTISYTGYDVDGNDYSGKVKITVEKGDSDGDIEYSVDADDEVDFKEKDFNKFCQDENDADLKYVSFELPSKSKGVLYYDYDDDKDKVDDSDKYYYDDERSISDVTFVPNKDYDGDCEIDFKGKDEDGNSIKGTIVISVDGDDDKDAGSAGTIYFSATADSSVTLFDSYFNSKCEKLTDESLNYVKFTLPSSSSGKLYYNYTSGSITNTEVSASTKYYYKSKSPYLKNVSFVPAGSSAQTVTIAYTGYDTEGTSYTGKIEITVAAAANSGSSTPSGTSPALAATATATSTSSKVVVDGKAVSFDAYNINGNNYFKLRDIAYAVNGTAKQFGVAYDSSKNAISLTSNSVYVAVGRELLSGDGKVKTATLSTSPIYKNGSLADLGAYNINDNNYFKLRDLAKAFNIGVSWNATANTVEITTANNYTE